MLVAAWSLIRQLRRQAEEVEPDVEVMTVADPTGPTENRIAAEAPVVAEAGTQTRYFTARRTVRDAVTISLPPCRRCEGMMVLRKNTATAEFFLGCNNFPPCRETREIRITYRT